MFTIHHRHEHEHTYRYDPTATPPPWVSEILRTAGRIHTEILKMAKTLDEILKQSHDTLDAVTRETDVDQGILRVVADQAQQIKDLRERLAEAGTDPAKLAELGGIMDQLATKVAANSQSVADAIKAHTPAAG